MVTDPRRGPSLPLLSSLNAGYVDTIGFLALHGLFTAHVTGNLVTLGASLALGVSGAAAKLLALPVFCIIVIITRLFAHRLAAMNTAGLRMLLAIVVLLLAASAGMAIYLGPFPNGDSIAAIATGLILVAAMAIQNAAHRFYFADSPATTMMTGVITQIMIDVADFLHGLSPKESTLAAAGLRRLAINFIAFAAGCGGAAMLYAVTGKWCFAVPPLLGFCALLLEI
jgi:uncharacterized membrane protein YoaK (UPF0700 family)